MTQADPLQIKAPAYLSRAEKASFRTLSAQLRQGSVTASPGFADILADYVAVRSRIGYLGAARARLIREKPTFTADKARIITLGREINAATALSLKLADKLGINA